MRSAIRIRQQILASLGGGLVIAAGVACGGSIASTDSDAGPSGTGGTGGTGGASTTTGPGAAGGSTTTGTGGSGDPTTGAGGAGMSGNGGGPAGAGGAAGGSTTGTGGTTTGSGGATGGTSGSSGTTGGTTTGTGGTTGGTGGATGGAGGTAGGMGGATGATGGAGGTTTGTGGAAGGTTTTGTGGTTTGGTGGAAGAMGGTGGTGCSIDAGSPEPECRADGVVCFSAAALAKYTKPNVDGAAPTCMLPSQCPQSYELSSQPYCGQYLGSVWPPSDAPPNLQCCYPKLFPTDGRPFFVEGESRQASTVERSDWLVRVIGDGDVELKDDERAQLAAAWLADARAEHASIATFARLTLQLLSLGAPPELLTAAQRATQDEIQHARLCFDLASRYAGRPLGPGKLAMVDAVTEVSLAELAVAAVHEGCLGETAAAVFASERLEQARDPQVRAALAKIARDETRHAALAWRTVVWAIECGGATVFEAVRAAFDEAVAGIEHRASCIASEDVDGDLASHGHASVDMARRVQETVVREIVIPLAATVMRGAIEATRRPSPKPTPNALPS